MKKLSYYILLFFSFLAISQTIKAEETSNVNSILKRNLNGFEISAEQALDLCKSVNKSRVQNQQEYLWTKVHSLETGVESESDDQQSKTQYTPGCYNIHYVQCRGTSRFPLGEDCGYFTLKQEKDCSTKSRSRRSVPTQSVTLTHGEALHLCTSLQNLPDDTPFQINYIPIKINLTPQMNSLHISEQCVKWVYKSCKANEDTSCNNWHLELEKLEKCVHYTNLFSKYNSSYIERFPHPIFKKTDFLHDENVKNENQGWNLDHLSNVVKCTTEKDTVVCQILNKTKDGRTKRETKDSLFTVSRVKRACCGLRYCGPCGRRSFAPRIVECDCSNDDGCAIDNFCDMKMYPSGCYGNCFVG